MARVSCSADSSLACVDVGVWRDPAVVACRKEGAVSGVSDLPRSSGAARDPAERCGNRWDSNKSEEDAFDVAFGEGAAMALTSSDMRRPIGATIMR